MSLPINQIICGDCREVMKNFPNKSIDLIVTDPPYGLDFNNGDLAHDREKVFGGAKTISAARPILNDGAEEAKELFTRFLIEAKRILKPGCCCCCCCCGGGGPKPLFAEWTLEMDRIIGFKHAVVWDKGGLGMGMHYRRNYEFMLIAQKPGVACTWNGGHNTPNIVKINKIIPNQDQHPTVKPVKLMAHFIGLHSNPGDIILDPFCGHGPTVEAAKKLGRKFIGIELNPDYCRMAEGRLAQEYLL